MYALERPGDRLVDHLEPTRHAGLSFTDRHAARDWLYAEASPLLSCVRQSSVPQTPQTLARGVDLLWSALDLGESGANSKQYETTAFAVLEAARAAQDRRTEVRALMTLADVHHTSGRFDQAEHEAEMVMRLVEAKCDPLPGCWAPNALGIMALYQNRHDDGEKYLTLAIDRFREIGDRPGEASALCNLSRIHLATGRTGSAVSLAQQGIDIYDSMGHALRSANGRYALGMALTQSGHFATATECLLEALDIFQDSRQRLWEGMTLFRLSEVDLASGCSADAATKAEQALTSLRGIGGEWRRGNVLAVLGRALSDIGQFGRAQACWREALAIHELLGSHEAAEVRALLASAAPAAPE
ncbi:Tetratricopeptide repeat-containing protein [Streptomyces sp. Ncost-T10-10d]|nr:Tetratricopeptide repeat-containing protein [Streptomyces sp. Ncost-T10-10d]